MRALSTLDTNVDDKIIIKIAMAYSCQPNTTNPKHRLRRSPKNSP